MNRFAKRLGLSDPCALATPPTTDTSGSRHRARDRDSHFFAQSGNFGFQLVDSSIHHVPILDQGFAAGEHGNSRNADDFKTAFRTAAVQSFDSGSDSISYSRGSLLMGWLWVVPGCKHRHAFLLNVGGLT